MTCINGNGQIDLNGNGYTNGHYKNGTVAHKEEEL